MYTEENEFNYDDYLDEADNYNSKKPFIDFKFILKVIAIIVLIVLIIFLVFKIRNKNLNNNKPKKDDSVDTVVVMNDNYSLVRDAAHIYFFENKHLPEKVGESNSVNVKELINEELLVNVKDSDGSLCGYNTSNATITRNKSDYELKINLVCASGRDEKIYYYDLEGKCLTCNGETYQPSSSTPDKESEEVKDPTAETKTETNNNNNNNTNSNVNNNTNNNNSSNNTNNNSNNNNNSSYVCGIYSNWTREYKNDSNLDMETRTLVKAYKNEVVYGEWSNETTEPITGSSNLEVRTSVKNEQVTSERCSNESTTKPASKDGRTITSRVESHSSTKKVCSGGKTITKTLTKWDNSAYSCKSYGIGKVVCTYKTKKTCTNKKTTSNVTYYKYCDTVIENVSKTYYQSRTISYNPVYTSYILESEIPSGYTKVDGSEIKEYRYREKCGK